MWRIDHYHYVGVPDDALARVSAELETLKGLIMATQAQLVEDITAVAEQVSKIGGETRKLLADIEALTAAVQAGGAVSAEVQTAMDALREQVAVVDALVPDRYI